MASLEDGKEYIPFALLIQTKGLVLVPAPIAKSLPAYRALFASLHASKEFCEMGFGPDFLIKTWSDEETLELLEKRCWRTSTGMGDFAVGRLVESDDNTLKLESDTGRALEETNQGIRVLEGQDFEALDLGSVEWVGYAGVRDATTTSMPSRSSEDSPLPPWDEMIELRYGVAQKHWGTGIARVAAEAVMQWAVCERGTRRFIAETERQNSRSGRVLEKLGFRLSGTNYWKEPSEIEWERIAPGNKGDAAESRN